MVAARKEAFRLAVYGVGWQRDAWAAKIFLFMKEWGAVQGLIFSHMIITVPALVTLDVPQLCRAQAVWS